MAKLAILLAVFSLLALHEVTAFRTTVTTTVVEEEERMNPEQQQRCEEQIRRQRSLQSCQRYLSQQQQQQSFNDLEMVVDTENPRQEEGLSQCCSELRNIEEQCRCQAVSHAFRQQRHQGQSERQQERQQERQTRQLAENLPSKCNLSPQRCQVESVWA